MADLADAVVADAAGAAEAWRTGSSISSIPASLPAADEGQCLDVAQGGEQPTLGDLSRFDHVSTRWKLDRGWWRDVPDEDVGGPALLASALAAALPRPSVVLTAAGKVVLSAAGDGVHMAFIIAPGAVPVSRSFCVPPGGSTDDSRPAAGALESKAAGAWAAALPRGTLVLMAVLCVSRDSLSAVELILTALREDGGLVVSTSLPHGSRVATAVGRKGQTVWNDSHTAADLALSSCPGFVPGPCLADAL